MSEAAICLQGVRKVFGVSFALGPLSLLIWMAVVGLLMSGFADAAAASDFPVSAAERTTVLEGAIQKLNQFYVFPEIARNMEAALRSRVARGEYQYVTSAAALATKLTADLREVSRDKHLRLEYFKDGAPPSPSGLEPTPEQHRKWLDAETRDNFGFARAEIMTGNVGYIELHSLDPAGDAAATVAAAMSFVAHSDALIIDLRNCLGGDPTGLVLMLSYLFDEPTHVDDMHMRWPVESVRQLWTFSGLPGPLVGSRKPVYLVTSHRTYSGCEAFAYALQAQRRAITVGEDTQGAAHLTVPIPISEHFTLAVPFGRSVNPVTHTDWEGKGVHPNIAAPAAQATEVAYRQALRTASAR